MNRAAPFSGRCALPVLLALLAWGVPGATRAADEALAARPAAVWRRGTWSGEPALASTSGPWLAIISISRARLIYFGPANRDANLLLAPPIRDNENILGGHRVWLGPQKNWREIWPPPAAWELEPPESIEQQDGCLRLHLRDAGGGWPRLTRTYRWEGTKLVCGAELRGGTRPAQVIQILQVPSDTVVHAVAAPAPDTPAGYVLLPSAEHSFARKFSVPRHLTREGDALAFHFTPRVLKPGLRPQALTGRRPGGSLVMERGTPQGTVVGAPDEGFFTQVYLGGDEPLIELEQLSPLFAAKEPAVFEIVVSAEAP